MILETLVAGVVTWGHLTGFCGGNMARSDAGAVIRKVCFPNPSPSTGFHGRRNCSPSDLHAGC